MMNIKDLTRLCGALERGGTMRMRRSMLLALGIGLAGAIIGMVINELLGVGMGAALILGGGLGTAAAAAGVLFRMEINRRMKMGGVVWMRICRAVEERTKAAYGFSVHGSDLWLARSADDGVRIMETRNKFGQRMRIGIRLNWDEGTLELFDPSNGSAWPMLDPTDVSQRSLVTVP